MTESNPFRTPTAELIGRAQRSDKAAWQELLKRFGPTLQVAVHGRIPTALRGRFSTADVLQSAFVDVLGGLGEFKYEDDEKFGAWLKLIATRKLVDRIRSHTRLARAPEAETHPDGVDGALVGNSRTPSEIVGDAERQAALLDALTRLAPEERDLVWLRLFEERTWPEIAKALELSISVAQRRYAHALSRLLRELD
ncbi:MAG: RNA polymerase sigma factor [Planctomycetes bacterium]|nr:RNA polymerase sigma factor [Planctomycetota bacterium]